MTNTNVTYLWSDKLKAYVISSDYLKNKIDIYKTNLYISMLIKYKGIYKPVTILTNKRLLQ